VVIRSGSSGLPAVLWANDMVTPANTSPASTPPTAPRSSRATSASSTCLRCIATMGDHLPAGSLPDTWRTAEPADPITAGRAGTTGRQALRTGRAIMRGAGASNQVWGRVGPQRGSAMPPNQSFACRWAVRPGDPIVGQRR
jgi:hypothetical protein